MTPFSEKKLLTTEYLQQVMRCTNVLRIFSKWGSFKGSDEVQKRTDNITTNEDVEKGPEKLEHMIEAAVTIRRKDSDKFEVRYIVSTGWFNL